MNFNNVTKAVKTFEQLTISDLRTLLNNRGYIGNDSIKTIETESWSLDVKVNNVVIEFDVEYYDTNEGVMDYGGIVLTFDINGDISDCDFGGCGSFFN